MFHPREKVKWKKEKSVKNNVENRSCFLHFMLILKQVYLEWKLYFCASAVKTEENS